MSTRIFKFNLHNNYDQCGGGKFTTGNRVKTRSGELATVLEVLSFF